MNFKYNLLRERALTGQFNWLTANVRTMLVTSAYAADPAHQFVSEIPAGAILIRGPVLTGKTATDGYARATTTRYGDFAADDAAAAIVFYVDSGSDATSLLVAYCDDESAFPFTPSGLNYDFAWDAIEGGFFRL